jgi:hypothetical protein
LTATCLALRMSCVTMVRTYDKDTGKLISSVRSIQIRTSLGRRTSIRISLYALPVAYKATVYNLSHNRKGININEAKTFAEGITGQSSKKYAESIHLASDYLESRGISQEVARLASLGVVAEPETGHEQYAGRLLYLT